jgi:DNA-binding NtrC family response regulator
VAALDEHLPEFVLVNLNQKDVAALDLVRTCVEHRSGPKVICTAKAIRIATAVQAVKVGALDVLERPIDAERLYRLLEDHKPPCEPIEPPSSNTRPVELTEPLVVDLLVADEERMQRALDRIDEAAKSERPITLVCERPLREQLARRYLAASPRAGGPFVIVAADSDEASAEDLLFGTAAQPSAFSLAKGGVVFVESLESLESTGRDRLANLLKGLAESRASGVEVRWPPMIIATEEEPAIDGRLEREVADQLSPTAIVVPRLHARMADAQRLLANIVQAIAKAAGAAGAAVDPRVAQAIMERSLTGGVAELMRMTTESARLDQDNRLVLELGREKERRPLKSIGLARPASSAGWAPTLDTKGSVQRFDVYEAEIFRFALRNAGGCVSRAAELLGVGRATMYRKMRAYQIDVPPVSERSIARGRRRTPPAEGAIVQ